MAISLLSVSMRALLLVGTVVGALGIALPALASEAPKGPSVPINASGVSETPMNLVYEICGPGNADTGLFKISLKNNMCLNGDSIRSHAESATTVGNLLSKPIHGEVRTIGIMHAILSEPQRVVLTNPTLSGVGDKLVSANGVTIEPVLSRVFVAEKVKVTCPSDCTIMVQSKERDGTKFIFWLPSEQREVELLPRETFTGVFVWLK